MNDDEPIFKRSRRGPGPYVYNVRNPIGLALTVITLILLVIMLVLMNKRMGPFAPPSSPERPPAEIWEWSPTSTPTTGQAHPSQTP
ncbi:hypothetical protein [Embleya sp. NPDC005575]|uniref:hypothetical protein n=1 Tax=Embleya sp. NPDC005575 TaxID=3156892 RepID=UPI0033B2570C